MFKAKAARVAAFVLIVAGAAVFISCQDGTTAPTPPPSGVAPSFDATAIWGYTVNPWNDPVLDVYVDWYCVTCAGEPIGSDAVDDVGRYNIDELQSKWDAHDGHDLEGMAYRDGYENAFRTIDDFDSSGVYQRDFEMIEE
jgi:hypothetical protein